MRMGFSSLVIAFHRHVSSFDGEARLKSDDGGVLVLGEATGHHIIVMSPSQCINFRLKLSEGEHLSQLSVSEVTLIRLVS
jgi:hypothetical protein